MKEKYYIIEIDPRNGQEFTLKRRIFNSALKSRFSMTYNSIQEAQRDMKKYKEFWGFRVYLSNKPAID